MRIVLVSNYFNHHQKPFCEEMYRMLGTDFVFVSTTEMREERKKLGYALESPPAYVLPAHESAQKQKEALALINAADVVIAGSAPNKLLLKRIRSGRLLLRYSERPFKKQISCLKRLYYTFYFRIRDLNRNNVYMLCAGAYAAGDYASSGMYKKLTYQWGYFPLVKEYDTDALLAAKKTNSILWCGRFIDWKHPDDAIRVARMLKEDGYDFHLNMVGTGAMEAELKKLVNDLDLNDVVHFHGSMSPERVRDHMEEAGIYLFTSDRQEGWGAVLNESMNSGCAVVASHEIGSVPYLLKDHENGMIYESGNVDMLYEKVKYMLNHPERQNQMGRAACKTMAAEWNASVAAQRLLTLMKHLVKQGEIPDLYESGPCSRAGIIKKDWFKDIGA